MFLPSGKDVTYFKTVFDSIKNFKKYIKACLIFLLL